MQYDRFVDNPIYIEKCQTFCAKTIRLDTLFKEMCNSDEFSDQWEVAEIVFVLSHGNASVESGFSIKMQILIENIKEDSVIAQRIIYDAVMHVGGVLKVNITPRMRNFFKNSHRRYKEALEKNKQESVEESVELQECEAAKRGIHTSEEKKRVKCESYI